MSAATKINEKRQPQNATPLLNVNARSATHYPSAIKKEPLVPMLAQQSTVPVVLGYSATVIDVDIASRSAAELAEEYTPENKEDRKEGLNEKYQLQLGEKQRTASTAEGLLVTPNKGDVVLCVEIDGHLIITQVLKRTEKVSPLVMSSSRPVEWVAPVLRFKALKEMELLAVNKLTLSASDLVFGAARTLVQQARNFIQQAKNYSLTTKDLLRLNARQQVIIAEEDIRIDAKRINMG
jgi:hypothetical protein